MVTKYQKRISGPLLDRIDIHIEVPRVDYEKLSGDRMGRQASRFANVYRRRATFNNNALSSSQSDIICNADVRIEEIRRFCKLQGEGGVLSLSKHRSLMRAAMSQLNLSARVYHRILKLARTSADLAGSEDIQSSHLAEALQYRPKLMMG